MKLLVLGGSLGLEADRLRLAAQGLALRGHEVLWSPGDAPWSAPALPAEGVDRLAAEIRDVGGGLRLARVRAELVVGAGAPARVALAGWLAGAQAMVLGLEDAAVARWSALDWWCWESLDAIGVRDPGDSESSTGAAAEFGPERLIEWPRTSAAPAAPSAIHPDTEILERLGERSRLRTQGRGPRPAVFVDRDGTLVAERNYLASIHDLELIEGVPQALRMLQAEGYALVVISNQAGVGRGLFPLERVYETMAALRILLRGHGLELDGIYFCPHRPDEGCACRKPGTLLIERATADLGLDRRRSVMIGDKLIDVATGQRAGARSILVRTGYGASEESAVADLERPPDHVANDLAAAARWLVRREGPRDQD